MTYFLKLISNGPLNLKYLSVILFMLLFSDPIYKYPLLFVTQWLNLLKKFEVEM